MRDAEGAPLLAFVSVAVWWLVFSIPLILAGLGLAAVEHAGRLEPQRIEEAGIELRGELIALHSASTYPGAQFYMECAQINVTGGSASKTPASVSLPGAYKGSDAGITYNLYSGSKTYTAPGPSVFKC